MSHIHWVTRGTGTEVCECDGWVCDLDVMGDPSKLSVIRKAVFEGEDSSRRRRGSFVVTCQPRLRPDLLNVCYRDDTRSSRGMKVPMVMSWIHGTDDKCNDFFFTTKNFYRKKLFLPSFPPFFPTPTTRTEIFCFQKEKTNKCQLGTQSSPHEKDTRPALPWTMDYHTWVARMPF
jgi:hypothetical protein